MTTIQPKLSQVPKFGMTAQPMPNSGPAKAKASTKSEEEAKRPPLVRGSIGKGILRALKMAFLRPRGWLELAAYFLAPMTLGISATIPLLFHVKHFAEGFLGCDSLYMNRWFSVTNLSGAVNSNTEGGGLLGGEKKLKPIEKQTHGSIVQRFIDVFSWKAPKTTDS